MYNFAGCLEHDAATGNDFKSTLSSLSSKYIQCEATDADALVDWKAAVAAYNLALGKETDANTNLEEALTAFTAVDWKAKSALPALTDVVALPDWANDADLVADEGVVALTKAHTAMKEAYDTANAKKGEAEASAAALKAGYDA